MEEESFESLQKKIHELTNKMVEMAYLKYHKSKLFEHTGDRIVILPKEPDENIESYKYICCPDIYYKYRELISHITGSLDGGNDFLEMVLYNPSYIFNEIPAAELLKMNKIEIVLEQQGYDEDGYWQVGGARCDVTEMKECINIIDIAKLGAQVGMEAKEQTLPNGKVVNSLVWDQEHLLKAVEAVKHLSEEGKPVEINGAAPAWLVSALTHTVHPCPVSVYVPQIGKAVAIPELAHGEANPEGEVSFKTTEKGDSVLIEYNLDLPEGVTTYDEENLPKVVVPEIPEGKAVYISGRGPNYLTTAIAEAYAHTNSSVSLFQPGVGYTCSITHSRSKRLGDLTKDPLGKEEIKEQLATGKEGQAPAID